MREAVGEGASFSQALGRHAEAFPSTYVNLVAAGEAGGFLPDVLHRLQEMDERREELRKIIMVWRQRVRSTAELRWLVDEGEITEDDLATLNLKPSALEVRARTHL